jgi:hypothetical protein
VVNVRMLKISHLISTVNITVSDSSCLRHSEESANATLERLEWSTT